MNCQQIEQSTKSDLRFADAFREESSHCQAFSNEPSVVAIDVDKAENGPPPSRVEHSKFWVESEAQLTSKGRQVSTNLLES